MPIIRFHMFEGTTIEQKRQLVKLTTDAVVKSLGVPAEIVIIQIVDLPKYNVSIGGKLASDST